MKMKNYLPLLTLFLFHNICAAQPGTLDTSFGVNGMVGFSPESPFDDIHGGNAILTAPDNKMLAVGFMEQKGLLVRFHHDGAIDTLSDFNFWGFKLNGGALVFGSGSYPGLGQIGNSFFNDIALQPDGKMVIIGQVLFNSFYDRYILMRQNGDGSWDDTFGEQLSGGTGFKIGPAGILGHSVAVQADGKILVVGSNKIVRHFADGQIDTSFAENGIFTISAAGISGINALLLQPDGKIIVASEKQQAFAMARLNADATLDMGFGIDGIATADISSTGDIIHSIELLPNGKIMAIGKSGNRLAVARFDNGILDMSYGDNGVAFMELTDKFILGNSSALQSDGKLVVAGYAGIQAEDNTHFFLARFTEVGHLDESFGDDGLVLTDPSLGPDKLFDLSIQQDDEIIVTGHTGEIPSGGTIWRKKFVVARYHSGLGVVVLEKTMAKSKLLISPNPTNYAFNIQVLGQANLSKAIFRILSVEGKVQKTFKAADLGTTFSVSVMDLVPGMYFLQYLEDNEVRAVERFVVSHP